MGILGVRRPVQLIKIITTGNQLLLQQNPVVKSRKSYTVCVTIETNVTLELVKLLDLQLHEIQTITGLRFNRKCRIWVMTRGEFWD